MSEVTPNEPPQNKRFFGLCEILPDEMFFGAKGRPVNLALYLQSDQNPKEKIKGSNITLGVGKGIGGSKPTVVEVEGRQPVEWDPLEWERIADMAIFHPYFSQIKKSWEIVFRSIIREDKPSEQEGAMQGLYRSSWQAIFKDELSAEVVLNSLRIAATLSSLRNKMENTQDLAHKRD